MTIKFFCLLFFVSMAAEVSYGLGITTFADAIERAKPGVVNIRTTGTIQKRTRNRDPYQFFIREHFPKITQSQSLGSGVIVDTKGHILTNYHVIQDAASIEILFVDQKKTANARVVGTDPKTDLAVLQATIPPGIRPVDLGNSDALRVGDIVLAIGNPFGYSHTVTSGIISAKGRVIGTGPYDDFLQTDAAIHPGNSGGPLIDFRGRVVGINSAVDSEAHGIGFALPINLAKQVMAELLKHGQVHRPFLGIVGRNVLSENEVGDPFDSVGTRGVLVENLLIDGPAHSNGVRLGDLIIGYNREKVLDLNHLQRLLLASKPKSMVSLRIYRRGKGYFTKSMTLSTTPAAEDLPKEKDLL